LQRLRKQPDPARVFVMRKEAPRRPAHVSPVTASLLLLLSAIIISPARAMAAHPSSGILWGVAESGLELGKGTKAGTNYSVPDPSYYLAHNVRLIRLPFQITRLQPHPMAPLDADFVRYMKAIVSADHAGGAITVLDPHGYGFYDVDGKPADLLQDNAAAADYVDLMSKLAAAFAHDDVAISLMNEPHTGSDASYAALWNKAIAAIRATGFRGTILVPHAHWGNARDISPQQPYEGSIQDPLHNWVLEVHLYLDPDSTGTYRQPVANATVGHERLAGAIAWAKASGVKLFLGETGSPPDATGVAALKEVLNDVAMNPDVFWGVSLWGAGAWWKPNYPMRLDPVDGVARPQFLALEDAFVPQRIYLAKPAGQSPVSVDIFVDGRQIRPTPSVTADLTAAPQAIAISQTLSPGSHTILLKTTDAGLRAYLLGSTWQNRSNSANGVSEIGPKGYSFKITVP
jgi:endoglucanase